MHAASSRITGVRLAIGIGECTVRGSMTGRAGQGRQWQAPKSEFCELDASSLKSAAGPSQDSGAGPRTGQCRAGQAPGNLDVCGEGRVRENGKGLVRVLSCAAKGQRVSAVLVKG